MRYWLSIWISAIVFNAFGQSEYEHAVRLFEEADSIRILEDERAEKDLENYHLAILKFEKARDTFSTLDSIDFKFRCVVQILKCQYFTDELDLNLIRDLEDQLIKLKYQNDLLGHAYYYKGVVLWEKQRYELAKTAFKKALRIFEDLKLDKEYVNSAWFIALVNSGQNNFVDVISYYEIALKYLRLCEPSAYVIRSLFKIRKNTIETYFYIGDYESHLKAIIECKKLAEKYPKWIGQSNLQNLDDFIGSSYILMGNYNKAYHFYQQLSNKTSNVSIALSFAQAMKGMGKLNECLNLYKEYLRSPISIRDKAAIYNNTGTTYIDLGQMDSAEIYISKALEINLRIEDQQRLGVNYGNLGDILHRQGNLKKANVMFHKGLSYRSTNQTEIKRLLSKNYFKLEEYDEALKFGESAVFDQNGNLLEQFRGNPFKRKLLAYQWLLSLYDRLRSIEELSPQGDRSIELIEKVHHKVRDTYSFFGDEMLALTSRLAFIYEYGIGYCKGQFDLTQDADFLDQAFQFSEWSKVQALERAKKTPGAKLSAGLPQEVLDLESRLKVHENFVKSQLSSDNDSSALARNQNRLLEIQESQDSLENLIRINYPRYHQLRYQDITLSVQEVQERLEPSQAFVEYYEGDTTSFVFTITKEDYQVERIHLDDDTLITRYREYFEPEHFQPNQQEINELSYQIYENYLEPAIGSLGLEITELIVVPDGKLSYVPFDILLTEPGDKGGQGSNAYLLRNYQVHYTYSASLYFNDFSTLSTKNQYLAFAPEYEATLTDTASINQLGNFRNQVTPLKHNQEEVSYISDNFKGLGYFGEQANERNFKEKVDEYGVLHLAMHTIVDDEDPMNSKLVFTNSKDTLEDDMLHAFEIYNMEIPSQLAVLSACETGFGQLAKGEGALSLARAFSYAGSPSVVMSHWPVDDQTTADLMKGFYSYLADGLTKSDALRRAKLDFLDRTHSARMHPFFWGSFVVMGDDSPVDIQRLPPFNPLWVVLLCLMVVGSGGYVVVRFNL